MQRAVGLCCYVPSLLKVQDPFFLFDMNSSFDELGCIVDQRIADQVATVKS